MHWQEVDVPLEALGHKVIVRVDIRPEKFVEKSYYGNLLQRNQLAGSDGLGSRYVFQLVVQQFQFREVLADESRELALQSLYFFS